MRHFPESGKQLDRFPVGYPEERCGMGSRRGFIDRINAFNLEVTIPATRNTVRTRRPNTMKMDKKKD